MDTSLSRRAFLKNAALAGAALIAAPALFSAVEPQQALAEEATSGTCTANVWVKPEDSAIQNMIGKDNVAYMTNPNTPLHGGFPTSAVQDNASYTDDGTTRVVTIPLSNTMFKLTNIFQWQSGAMTINEAATEATRIDGRLTALVVEIPSGNTAGTFQFKAEEYAGFALFAGTKTWPINIVL